MQPVDLLLDEENELTFQLSVEGSSPGKAECRLMLENSDMKLSFDADSFVDDEVNIILPPLGHVLKEGVYDMSLEVIVDDRYFKPLTLQGNFEKRLKVTAEARTVKKKKAKTSASLLGVTSKKSNRLNEKKSTVATATRQKKKTKDFNDNQIMEIIKALASS